jgi:hypothetical protein
MKHPRMLAALGIAAGMTAAGITASYAATDTTTQTNPMSNLVQAIATKFNLNEADVQTVFDEQREQMQTERKENFTTRVNAAVTDGTLTQAQADAIFSKMEEMETARENKDASLTQEERRAKMEDVGQELKAWVEENDIPREFVPMLGHGGPRGGHGPFGAGPDDGQPVDTQTDSGDTSAQ